MINPEGYLVGEGLAPSLTLWHEENSLKIIGKESPKKLL